MTRSFRQQIDAGILDRAAALFARRGFAKTSVQDIADAVGLSKAGLLHHFPSKDALREAVLAHADSLRDRALDAIGDLPSGPDRDRRAVEVLVDLALAHPGLVALLLSTATSSDAGSPEAETATALSRRTFDVDPDTDSPERLVRVLGAQAALAVLSLAAHDSDAVSAWRPHIVATCLDALGHARPTPAPGPAVPPPSTPKA